MAVCSNLLLLWFALNYFNFDLSCFRVPFTFMPGVREGAIALVVLYEFEAAECDMLALSPEKEELLRRD